MVSSLGDALNEFKEINFIQYYSVNIYLLFFRNINIFREHLQYKMVW